MFNLKIENFRSFKSEEFKFSKINILIGENSSGKSSLFKLILAMKQTLQLPQSREINFSFSGGLSDLGSFRESVYYHNDLLPMTIEFSVVKNYSNFFYNSFMVKEEDNLSEKAEEEKGKIRAYIGKDIQSFTKLRFVITKDLDRHDTISSVISNPDLGEIEISFPGQRKQNEEQERIFGPRCQLRYFDAQLDKTFLFEVEYQKEGFITLVLSESLLAQINKLLQIRQADVSDDNSNEEDFKKYPVAHTLYYRIAYLLVTQNFLKYYLDKVEYINPIFTRPSRVYLYRDEKNSLSVKDIEDVVEFFSSSSEFSRAVFKDFSRILESFGIVEGFEVLKDDRLPVRELRVKIKDLVSNITDVGYGVSLQLPIILKALISDKLKSRRNSILLIEQPEVHLHPKLHAQLVEVLLSLSRYNTYFIETHSEHIIRKLQILVKEKRYNLKTDDITIHYLKRSNRKTEVTSHSIDENGFLAPPLPMDFFDNSYLLAKDLLD